VSGGLARGVASITLAATIVAPIGSAQTRGGGITARALLNNATLGVARLTVPPTTSELVTATAPSTLVVQVTAGDVEITQLDDDSRGPREPGAFNFVPSGIGHMGRNIGSAPYDVLLVAIKPTRTPAAAVPATEAPPGITRTTVLENDEVRVVRVRFAPGAREPDHSHPYDLLTVQIDRATVGILNGTDTSVDEREPGFVQFLPRGVVHAYGSVDAKPFEILSIAAK
jgi:quercetin dioxygenase-like cupin family protein